MIESSRGYLDIIEADGRLSVREVVVVVFYIRKLHFDVGPQIEEAILGFAKLVSFERLRFFADSEGEWQDLLERGLSQRMADEYVSFANSVNASITLRGAGQDPPDFYLRYGGDMRAGEQEYASYFQCWVPKDYWLAHRDELEQFSNHFASRVPFGFGYLSVAAVGDDRRPLQRLARRYLTVDIASPGAIALDVGDFAGGSYWVTYLGQPLCESLGGVAELRRVLPQGAVIQEMDGGKCRVQLGPDPTLGDVNRREDISLYKALAAYFQSHGVLHLPKRVVYFTNSAGMADQVLQDEWHHRFVT